MKRVTILVDDIGEPDGDGERLLVGSVRSVRGLAYDPTVEVYVAADRILSIEDHVEPLPTEPGTRFWARLGDDEPQWWFVREVKPSGVYYTPARGTSVSGIHAQRLGLVRLPDPKPTETDGDAR